MGRVMLPLYTPLYQPTGHEVAVIETTKGAVRVKLDGRGAPATVGNFVELAARGFYDDLKFHACKPGSVVLGGCPTTRALGPAQVEAAARGVIRGVHPGTGDARYTIADEWEGNPNNRHVLGSLCMAHKSDVNSGSCQFYFSLSEQPEFDDRFTVFGMTIDGLDAVERLDVGDVIKGISLEGVDQVELDEAVSRETPKPCSMQEVLQEQQAAEASEPIEV
ncbi:MAG: peptidylprolyl isomerase [Gordonibacter sp.]|uniref:peptidylprolyl isomerase n=1 Tax=Gordonibacter sp. TaxID=1968902 RepID=UPI002FCBEC9B